MRQYIMSATLAAAASLAAPAIAATIVDCGGAQAYNFNLRPGETNYFVLTGTEDCFNGDVFVTGPGSQGGSTFSWGWLDADLNAISGIFTVTKTSGSPLDIAILDALGGQPLQLLQFAADADNRSAMTFHYRLGDDFEVAPVPLPAAGALLLAGLGGFAALKRRKGAAAA